MYVKTYLLSALRNRLIDVLQKPKAYWTDYLSLGLAGRQEAVRQARLLVLALQMPDYTVSDEVADQKAHQLLRRIQSESVRPTVIPLSGSSVWAILQRADLTLKRAKECGFRTSVFGSGGSRAIPDGFNREKAKAQHIALCQKMAPLAEKYGVTLAVEPLNRGETNFINSLAEGVDIIRAVNNPWFRLQCDIYHMLKEDEKPQEIIRYGEYITHCHMAEKQSRTAPGIKGDDFRPYFRALKQIKYQGGLSLECNWTDFDTEIARGIHVVKAQLAEV